MAKAFRIACENYTGLSPRDLSELTYDQLYLLVCDKDQLIVEDPPDPDVDLAEGLPVSAVGEQSLVKLVRQQIAAERQTEHRKHLRRRRQRRSKGLNNGGQ